MNRANTLTPAFILHRKSYSDSSLLIDLFSLQYGKITCIAKGVKTGKKQRASILQPFIPLMVSITGKGEVKTLSISEAAGNRINLERNALYSAYYINELLLKLLQKNEVHETVFAAYGELLISLADNVASAEKLLRYFEINLLNELGYGLQLTHDVTTTALVDPDKLYCYETEHGPRQIQSNTQLNSSIPVVSGSTLIAMNARSLLSEQELKESKLLMRHVIQHLLGGYDFKSRIFFNNNFKGT